MRFFTEWRKRRIQSLVEKACQPNSRDAEMCRKGHSDVLFAPAKVIPLLLQHLASPESPTFLGACRVIAGFRELPTEEKPKIKEAIAPHLGNDCLDDEQKTAIAEVCDKIPKNVTPVFLKHLTASDSPGFLAACHIIARCREPHLHAGAKLCDIIEQNLRNPSLSNAQRDALAAIGDKVVVGAFSKVTAARLTIRQFGALRQFSGGFPVLAGVEAAHRVEMGILKHAIHVVNRLHDESGKQAASHNTKTCANCGIGLHTGPELRSSTGQSDETSFTRIVLRVLRTCPSCNKNYCSACAYLASLQADRFSCPNCTSDLGHVEFISAGS